MFRIVRKQVLAPTITRFDIDAPFIAKKRKAGNFVMIRVEKNGERIPLTIADRDPARGTITLIVQAIGKTTKHLCSKNEGDDVLDVVGPLGNPTPIERIGHVVCVGGGVGTAELYPIARALQRCGKYRQFHCRRTLTRSRDSRTRDARNFQRHLRHHR